MNSLGSALRQAGRQAGRVAEAVKAYSEALEIFGEFAHWYRTGQVLHNLALVHESVGHEFEAHACWIQAANMFNRAGDTAKADRSRKLAAEQARQPHHLTP
ncbi:hypothetical protein AB0945_29080 [Streptomyces sp. NPDC005474]|uniref:hypothetical protein n=1 Tax=Streptomyces sp. NPDC005474 TaxID=3154878 RepID=UPI00345277E9